MVQDLHVGRRCFTTSSVYMLGVSIVALLPQATAPFYSLPFYLYLPSELLKATPGTGLHCKLLRRSYWQVQQFAEEGQAQAP